jgi:prolyl-tRNA synthetase
MAKNCCVLVRRDNKQKTMDVALDTLAATLYALFDTQHRDLLAKARVGMEAALQVVTQWPEFVPALNNKRMVLAAWCNTVACEKAIKVDSGEEAKTLAADGFALTASAKSLCIPANQGLAGRELPEKCFHCANKATTWCFFGRSY